MESQISDEVCIHHRIHTKLYHQSITLAEAVANACPKSLIVFSSKNVDKQQLQYQQRLVNGGDMEVIFTLPYGNVCSLMVT